MPEHDHLPHLRPVTRQPIIFLTAVAFGRRPILACGSAHIVLREIWTKSDLMDGWSVGRYVIMPDHVHLFARAAQDAKPLAKWVQTWKSLSSRKLINELNVTAPVWQKDYFDRFLRSSESYADNWDYVLENPVRKNLVCRGDDWPWQGVVEDLSF